MSSTPALPTPAATSTDTVSYWFYCYDSRTDCNIMERLERLRIRKPIRATTYMQEPAHKTGPHSLQVCHRYLQHNARVQRDEIIIIKSRASRNASLLLPICLHQCTVGLLVGFLALWTIAAPLQLVGQRCRRGSSSMLSSIRAQLRLSSFIT